MMDKIISDHRQLLDEIKGILARKCKDTVKIQLNNIQITI